MAEFKNYVGMYICQMIDSAVESVLTNRSQNVDGTEIRRKAILRVIDKNWADQMEIMDDIKSGVYLDALGKQDPYVKYRDEVYSSFEQMKFEIARGIIKSEATVLLLYRKAEQSRDSKIG